MCRSSTKRAKRRRSAAYLPGGRWQPQQVARLPSWKTSKLPASRSARSSGMTFHRCFRQSTSVSGHASKSSLHLKLVSGTDLSCMARDALTIGDTREDHHVFCIHMNQLELANLGRLGPARSRSTTWCLLGRRGATTRTALGEEIVEGNQARHVLMACFLPHPGT